MKESRMQLATTAFFDAERFFFRRNVPSFSPFISFFFFSTNGALVKRNSSVHSHAEVQHRWRVCLHESVPLPFKWFLSYRGEGPIA